jgi:hypothetical protein
MKIRKASKTLSAGEWENFVCAIKIREGLLLTCRSRPSAMWRSPATSFVGYRPPGSTDRLLG